MKITKNGMIALFAITTTLLMAVAVATHISYMDLKRDYVDLEERHSRLYMAVVEGRTEEVMMPAEYYFLGTIGAV